MLITRSKKETIEIALPYYSQDGSVYYRINPDESVLRVHLFRGHAGISLSDFTQQEAVSATPISAEEFESKLIEAISYMDATLSKTQKSFV